MFLQVEIGLFLQHSTVLQDVPMRRVRRVLWKEMGDGRCDGELVVGLLPFEEELGQGLAIETRHLERGVSSCRQRYDYARYLRCRK